MMEDFGKHNSNIIGSLGLRTAWVKRVKENYLTFEDLAAADELFGIASRVGYNSVHRLWDDNPIMYGSTDPKDLRIATEDEYLLENDSDRDDETKARLAEEMYGSKGMLYDISLPRSFLNEGWRKFSMDLSPHFVWIYPKGTFLGEPGPLSPAASRLLSKNHQSNG